MKGSKIEFLFVHVIFRDIFQHISYFKGAIVETILPIVKIFQGEYFFKKKVLCASESKTGCNKKHLLKNYALCQNTYSPQL
jgi:hypothetical protein